MPLYVSRSLQLRACFIGIRVWVLQHWFVWVFLLQSSLLFYRLDMLPIWGDEQFTLDTSSQSLGRIVQIVKEEFHPPLYYFLVHFWLRLPWPGHPILAIRALSILAALTTTLVLYKLWLGSLDTSTRRYFLLLWSLSPCLLLYARMARYYSLSMLLFSIGLFFAVRALSHPWNRRRMVAYSVAVALLMYVHYLPGVALLLACTTLSIIRTVQRRSPTQFWTGLLSVALSLVLYLPWISHLLRTLARVRDYKAYWLVDNMLLEHSIRLLYTFVSFTAGESLPFWLMIGAGVTLAAAALRFAGNIRQLPCWASLVLLAALIGYVGACRVVSFAFVPARLLFVLPFYYLWLTKVNHAREYRSRMIYAGVVIVSVASTVSYFRKDGFLNKGYLIPFDQIVGLVRQEAASRYPIILVNTSNTDVSPLTAELQNRARIIFLEDSTQFGPAMQKLPRSNIIWYLRNTHEIGGSSVRFQDQDIPGEYQSQSHLFVPYLWTDHLVMKLLGWEQRPTHVFQVIRLVPLKQAFEVSGQLGVVAP